MEENYYLNSCFELYVLEDGTKAEHASADLDAKFMEVDGLGMEIECEELMIGGANMTHYQLPKRIKRTPLILKRGVVNAHSELMLWVMELMVNGFDQGIQKKDLALSLLDSKNFEPIKTWTFTKAFPVKWAFGNMKAMDQSIFMEEIHFTYQKLMIL